MNLIRYQRSPRTDFSKAWSQLSTLSQDLDQVFDFSPFFASSRWSPALDVYQDNDQFTVVVDLPGMKKEEIGISFHDGTLTLSGERKQEEIKGERAERFHGQFERNVTFPGKIDSAKVNATYQDGILKVTLPKTEETKPKEIKISVD
jgi:HSP20 family protein